ncbi:MAG: crosslink repair DNA glycosylase YcaQ family protein [Myxococcota bacterium]
MTLRPVDVLRFRARRAALDRTAATPHDVIDAVAALHGTDPATVHLAVWARTPVRPIDAVAADVQAAHEDRSVVQVLAMRRTLHVVPAEEVPAALGVAKARLYGPQRRLLDQLLVDAGLVDAGDAEAAYRRLAEQVLDALTDEDLPSDALAERVPDLARRVARNADKPYGGMVPLNRHVLEAMGHEGLVVRARPLGGWRRNSST